MELSRWGITEVLNMFWVLDFQRSVPQVVPTLEACEKDEKPRTVHVP